MTSHEPNGDDNALREWLAHCSHHPEGLSVIRYFSKIHEGIIILIRDGQEPTPAELEKLRFAWMKMNEHYPFIQQSINENREVFKKSEKHS